MNLIAEGKTLGEIPEFEGSGQLRIYVSNDLTNEQVQDIEEQIGLPVRYDMRILEIDFKGAVPIPSIEGIEGWQLFSTEKVDWALMAVVGALALVGAKKWHSNTGRK